MIVVTADPSANGWRGETYIEIGHRRLLVHQSDNHADPDVAEEAETSWAFQAFAAFFEFIIAQDAPEEPDEESLEELAELEEAEESATTARPRARKAS